MTDACCRELVEVHKKSLFQQLMDEHNPSHAYHLAVLVMYAKAHHMVLHVPGKLITSVLEVRQLLSRRCAPLRRESVYGRR